MWESFCSSRHRATQTPRGFAGATNRLPVDQPKGSPTPASQSEKLMKRSIFGFSLTRGIICLSGSVGVSKYRLSSRLAGISTCSDGSESGQIDLCESRGEVSVIWWVNTLLLKAVGARNAPAWVSGSGVKYCCSSKHWTEPVASSLSGNLVDLLRD